MIALRRDPELAAIPILVITGQAETDFGQADAVLRKPLDPQTLLTAIEDLLRRKRG